MFLKNNNISFATNHHPTLFTWHWLFLRVRKQQFITFFFILPTNQRCQLLIPKSQDDPCKDIACCIIWLVVSTSLKNRIVKLGSSSLTRGENEKNVWNHHLVNPSVSVLEPPISNLYVPGRAWNSWITRSWSRATTKSLMDAVSIKKVMPGNKGYQFARCPFRCVWFFYR